MEEIGSQTWLAWVACKAVKGTMPDKIRRVVDRPRDLRADQDVLFDRWKQVGTRSVSAYGRYVLVTEDAQVYERASADGAVLLVDDIDAAYWRFVRHYREQFQIPVFAVTGTCGKTTTKEMIKQILSAKYRVQATVRSKNAGSFHLGYLLGIDASTDVAVFETGVSKRGDLLEACDYYRPTVGVVTNIGIDHLNAFHTQEAYIRAKEEILAGLTYQGTMVINGDDPNIAKFDWSRYKGRVLTFGLGQLADFRAEEIRVADGGMAFTLRYQHMAHRLFVPGYGKHNVYNALAAIAAAYAIGVGIAEAGEALRSYHHLQGHMNVLPGVKGSVVIDDTWNSNPTSMETALQVLCDLAGGRKKIAVLGRMAALGDAADEQYEKIGKRLVECGVDVLITKGSIAKDFAKHALKHGMRESQVFPCYEVEEIIDCLKRVVDQESIVLMKASMNDTQMGDLLQSILLSE